MKKVHSIILNCERCEKEFVYGRDSEGVNHYGMRFCSKKCRRIHNKANKIGQLPYEIDGRKIATGTVGSIGELMVAVHLMKRGWHVFRPLSSHCFCDLIAFREGRIRYIEVRLGIQLLKGRVTYGKHIHQDATEFAIWTKTSSKITFVKMR